MYKQKITIFMAVFMSHGSATS